MTAYPLEITEIVHVMQRLFGLVVESPQELRIDTAVTDVELVMKVNVGANDVDALVGNNRGTIEAISVLFEEYVAKINRTSTLIVHHPGKGDLHVSPARSING